MCLCVRERDDVGSVEEMQRDVWERNTSPPLLSVRVCHDVPVLGRVDKAETLTITSTLGLRRDIQSDCMHGYSDIMSVEHISSCYTRRRTLFSEILAQNESESDSDESGAACALSCL